MKLGMEMMRVGTCGGGVEEEGAGEVGGLLGVGVAGLDGEAVGCDE